MRAKTTTSPPAVRIPIGNIARIGKLLWATALVCAVSGCDGNESEEPETTEPSNGSALTADYFHGTWCLRSVGAYGQGGELNVPYVFRDDGSLQFQTRPEATVQTGGVWRVEDGGLYLEAGPLLGTLDVKEGSQDHFVIDFTALYRFERGDCG